MRLTQEREQEIRFDSTYRERELLAEIDAIRAQLDSKDWNGQYWKDLEKENEKLKAENETLQVFYDTHVGTQLELFDTIDARYKFETEIQKLRERDAKLREACAIHLRTMAEINAHMGYKFTQPLMLFREALAQDDEMNK